MSLDRAALIALGHEAPRPEDAELVETMGRVLDRLRAERRRARGEKKPAYNHTRGDSVLTPCPICASDAQ